jgi:hypothetical protein
VDGAGVFPGGPETLRRIRRILSRYAWRRVPNWSRPVLIPVSRVVWFFACPLKAILAMKTAPAPVSLRDFSAACWIGWSRGRQPVETLATRPLVGKATGTIRATRKKMARECPGDLQSIALWCALSDPAEVALVSDKLASATLFSNAGFPVPQILAELTPQSPVDLTAPPWTSGTRLFLKSRHGSAARGAAAVLCGPNQSFSVDDGPFVSEREFLALVMNRTRRDSILVEPFLDPSEETRDISPQAPTWLRIFTLRPWGGAPFLLSGTLKIVPAGSKSESRIGNILMVPVSPDTGVLMEGILLTKPAERFQCVPWNGARLAGRPLADWHAARTLALRAADLLPGSPLIGWDVLLAADGPVILEANHGLSWFRADLWHFETGTPSPLADLALQWIDHSPRDFAHVE